MISLVQLYFTLATILICLWILRTNLFWKIAVKLHVSFLFEKDGEEVFRLSRQAGFCPMPPTSQLLYS